MVLKKWLDADILALNIDKTNFVVFHPPRIKIPESVIIRFGRKKIKRESCVRFLGVLLDENLNWKFHINELSKNFTGQFGSFIKSGTFVHLIFCEYFIILCLFLFIIRYFCLGFYLQILFWETFFCPEEEC